MKTLLALLLALWSACAPADVEVIPLRHRLAEEVLPALRPHLEPGAGLSAFGNKLIISASPGNLARLRQILAAIDQPLRQLVISVRQEGAWETADRGAGVSGRLGGGEGAVTLPEGRKGPGAQVEIGEGRNVLRGRVWSTQELREGRADQQVRVVEGGTAHIQTGMSVPVALRQVVLGPAGAVVSEAVVWRDLGTGFTAVPTLAGETVTLEIGPRQETPMRGPYGAAQVQRLSTTVRGRLGEWIPLGDSDQATATHDSGYVTHSTRDLRRQGRILLRVEEVK